MSPIKLNGSTSGFVALDAPAAAGSNTLVLPTGNGSSGQYLQTNGSGALSWSTSGLPAQVLTLGTSVASTSGTSIDFTSIPSTVKRIALIMSGVSTSGTSHIAIRLGTSSGIVSSGYSGSFTYQGAGSDAGTQVPTTYFGIWSGSTNDTTYSNVLITNVTGNTWVYSNNGGMISGASGYGTIGGGTLALSGTLDRVRITTGNGTDTFDAGTINIMYEG